MFEPSHYPKRRGLDNVGGMLEFVSNLYAPQIRRETLNGKEYIVASGTLIVPGVLPGSQGSLYYPPEECAMNVDAWNHVPLTIYHPTLHGQAVSASNPDVLEKQGVGFVAHTTFNGKLRAEHWFDVERTRRIDNRVLRMLEKGDKIELSTGLFTDNVPAHMNANYNGRSYDATATNYRPDHVAILPDQTGACSVRDGCGVNNHHVHNDAEGDEGQQSSRA